MDDGKAAAPQLRAAALRVEVQQLAVRCARCGWRLSILSRIGAHARAETRNGFFKHLTNEHGVDRLYAETAGEMKTELASLKASAV